MKRQTIIICVRGGVADVESCPSYIDVIIKDYDVFPVDGETE